MFAERLKARTKYFAVRIIRLYQALPNTSEAQVLGKQLLRSGTSVAANYRAALRGRSRNEFVAKLGVVVEEADESLFWLELIRETAIFPASKITPLEQEAREILSVMATARNSTKARK